MQQLGSADLADTMHNRCLGSRVARLQRQIGRRFDQALAPFGLTMAQLEILAALEMTGRPIAPSALASVLAVDRSTISRNLTLLQERGLVGIAERTPTGRAKTVWVTPEGRARLEASGEAWTAAQRDTEAALGAGSPDQIDRWLEALSANP